MPFCKSMANSWTVDLGIYPEQKIPSPLQPTSVNIFDTLDTRRIRVVNVQQLSNEVQKGNTLLPQKDLVMRAK